jgi:hypothetical protein
MAEEVALVDTIRPLSFAPHAHVGSGIVRNTAVRGNHPSGFDDYEESWFG